MKFKNIKKKTYKKKSPNNSRSISDPAKATAGKPLQFKFTFSKIDRIKFLKVYGKSLKIFVVSTFVVAVVIVGFDLQGNLRKNITINSQRKILVKELNFWNDFIAKNSNYPDAYFQASRLEYRLGDIYKAKINVEKGLVLDPNSQSGRKIEEFLNR